MVRDASDILQIRIVTFGSTELPRFMFWQLCLLPMYCYLANLSSSSKKLVWWKQNLMSTKVSINLAFNITEILKNQLKPSQYYEVSTLSRLELFTVKWLTSCILKTFSKVFNFLWVKFFSSKYKNLEQLISPPIFFLVNKTARPLEIIS